jgi:hypothetical protein
MSPDLPPTERRTKSSVLIYKLNEFKNAFTQKSEEFLSIERNRIIAVFACAIAALGSVGIIALGQKYQNSIPSYLDNHEAFKSTVQGTYDNLSSFKNNPKNLQDFVQKSLDLGFKSGSDSTLDENQTHSGIQNNLPESARHQIAQKAGEIFQVTETRNTLVDSIETATSQAFTSVTGQNQNRQTYLHIWKTALDNPQMTATEATKKYTESAHYDLSKYRAFDNVMNVTYKQPVDVTHFENPYDITTFVKNSLHSGNVHLHANPKFGIKNNFTMDQINRIAIIANQNFYQYRKSDFTFKEAFLPSMKLAVEDVTGLTMDKQTYLHIWKTAIQNPNWPYKR